jgi:hypothetical protein
MEGYFWEISSAKGEERYLGTSPVHGEFLNSQVIKQEICHYAHKNS